MANNSCESLEALLLRLSCTCDGKYRLEEDKKTLVCTECGKRITVEAFLADAAQMPEAVKAEVSKKRTKWLILSALSIVACVYICSAVGGDFTYEIVSIPMLCVVGYTGNLFRKTRPLKEKAEEISSLAARAYVELSEQRAEEKQSVNLF